MSIPLQLAAALLGAFSLLGMLGLSATHPSEKIVIGSVLSLTGDGATDALNIQRGLELAKEDLAKKGITVEIKYEDDQTDPAKTVTATRRIIDLYQPQAFVGFTWDFLLNAAAPVVDEARVPSYSPANTAGVSGVRSPYVFFGAPRNETKVEPIAAFLEERGARRVAVVIQTSAWGLNHIDVFTQAAIQAGASVVLNEKTEYGSETSALPTVTTKIRAQAADVLLWSGGRAGLAVLLPKLQEQGVDIPVIAEVDLEGVVADGVIHKKMRSDWLVTKTAIDQSFDQKFRNKYGESPGIYADIAYDGLMVLVEAIRNTDGTPEAISAYLGSGKVKYKGYSVDSFRFDEQGGLEAGTWMLNTI